MPGEPGSFVERTYLHLSSREELAADFGFLELERLDEIAYREERPAGAPHDHVELGWWSAGRRSLGYVAASAHPSTVAPCRPFRLDR